jgi:hypothetical protein
MESAQKGRDIYRKKKRMPTPRKITKIELCKKFTSNPDKIYKQPIELILKDNNGISEFSTSDDYRYKRHSSYIIPDRLSLMIGKLDIKSNRVSKVKEYEVRQNISY